MAIRQMLRATQRAASSLGGPRKPRAQSWHTVVTPRELRKTTYDRSVDALLSRPLPVMAAGGHVHKNSSLGDANIEKTVNTVDIPSSISAFDTLHYPLHEASRAELLHTIRPLLSPFTSFSADSMPSVSSGLVTLSAPYRGAELYLEAVTKCLAAELDADFVSLRSADLFERVSPYAAMATTFPVESNETRGGARLVDMREGRPNELFRVMTFDVKSRSSLKSDPSTLSPVLKQPFIALEEDSNGENARNIVETYTHQIGIPYPWYKPYLNHGLGNGGGSVKDQPKREGIPMLIPPPISEPNYSMGAHRWIADKVFEYINIICQVKPTRPKIFFYQDLLHLFQRSSSTTNDRDMDMNAVATALLAGISKVRYQDSARYAPFVVIVPHTGTFPTLIPSNKRTVGGGIIQVLNDLRSNANNDEVVYEMEEFEEDTIDLDVNTKDISLTTEPNNDTDESSSSTTTLSTILQQRINKQKYNFSSFLDSILGVPSIPIIPTTHYQEMIKFKRQLSKDAKRIIAETNLIELSQLAEHSNIRLPFSVLDLSLRTHSTYTTLLDQFSDIKLFSSELISSLDAERLLLLSTSYATQLTNTSTVVIVNQSGLPESLPMTAPERKLRAARIGPPLETVIAVTVEELANAAFTLQESRNAIYNLNAPAVLNHLLPSNLVNSVDTVDVKSLSPGSQSLLRLVKRIQSGKESTLSQHEETIIKQCFVMPSALTTTFNRIGGLDKPKQIIHDIIQLPLQRPDLFRQGILKQSTTGLLLFGPPGTGKTMLARATAAESGANFLSVSMVQIQSMWVGENEKNVCALFSLARKLKPCIIFVDEIDALLQTRNKGFTPHWAINTINEFMQEWDGIQAESNQGIIVMGSTNRYVVISPFDLDEAVLRRLPRRILIDLPDVAARHNILDILLKDDQLAGDVSLDELATRTDMYSGSDLKNLCLASALICAREHTQQTSDIENREHKLQRRHFDEGFKNVLPSLERNSGIMKQLREWDTVYGTRGLMLGKGFGFV